VRLIERIWFGDTAADRMTRAALMPLESLYRGVVTLRGELYDHGLIPAHRSPIAVVSVGNITVGGTGKTPVSAWIASRLASMGCRPAIVLRGYGGDEPLVHARLNPEVPVIVAPDRNAGIAEAARGGADVAVLDDAFQHRRTARDADIVLLSADDWHERHRVLPAGPYREPPSALKRASLIVIARKVASDDQVERVERMAQSRAPGVPIAIARLRLSDAVRQDSPRERMPVAGLAEKRVLAIAAVGNPGAFFRQLEAAGAHVTPRSFPDHHAFTPAEIDALVTESDRFDSVVCTLKDVVKAGPQWPAEATPLWYVSLHVEIERGDAALDSLLVRLQGRTGVG
jgi:tetraacyldisaccharide 4'-kinase